METTKGELLKLKLKAAILRHDLKDIAAIEKEMRAYTRELETKIREKPKQKAYWDAPAWVPRKPTGYY